MPVQLTLALILVATSVSSALVALLVLSMIGSRSRGARVLAGDPPPQEAVFLFDDQELIDATPSARSLLETAPIPGGDWPRLSACLAQRFEDVEARLARLAEEGRVELSARAGSPLRLRAEAIGHLARITVYDPGAEGGALTVDALSQRALEEELAALRRTVDAAPLPIWRQDAAGAVVWANRDYLALAGLLDEGRADLTWPLPALFAGDPAPGLAPGPRRVRLDRAGKAPVWYECHSTPLGEAVLSFALPADAAVRAEAALRDFVQTLTKTFAHLPIGLAVFDRQRQLALFNPALTDLTGLGAEFLSARPTLYAFLDRLREAHVLPEPKDYKSWRQQMAELEKAASSGQYEETWTLPTGQTYRVTGRPHPDGAVAFLIEDITAEISLTRRFRADLELGQAVADSLSEAIAVFSPAGLLVMSNAPYARLWGADPGATLGEVTIIDSIRLWQGQSLPTPIWGDARDFVSELGGRAEWTGTAHLRDGRRLACRFTPLSGGATLAGFTLEPPARPHLRARTYSLPRPQPGIGAETEAETA